MKILVYDDLGASSTSVKHIVAMLKSTLCQDYVVDVVDRKVFDSEEWQTECAMLVMPGGRDLPYCQALDGRPNQAIKAFVENGGRYLGICAGAYYASESIEFEKGNPQMEIIAPRPLGFYPGLCRGTAYPGFSYSSERGARLVPVSLNKEAFESSQYTISEDVWMYYNGGGYFVDADQYSDQVTVLCGYKELDNAASIVHCRVGKGHALLISTHPEYEATSDDLLAAATTDNHHLRLLNQLALSRTDRNGLMRLCFSRIGLKLDSLENTLGSKVKKLTPSTMYFTGLTKACVSESVSRLQKQRNSITYLLHDATDSFCISDIDDAMGEQAVLFNMCRVREGKPPIIQLIYPTLTSAIEPLYPPHSVTPQFSSEAYYRFLVQKRQREQNIGTEQQYVFGNSLIYTSNISRTISVFTENPKFLEGLSSGLVCIGLNEEQNQDVLCFSIVLRHSFELKNAPVVFLQYLISLAIVKCLKSVGKDLSVHIKWPSGIYLKTKMNLIGIGQSKTHLSFVDNQYVLVIDNQVNLTDIRDAMPASVFPALEDILADIVTKFESMYTTFCQRGIEDRLLQEYCYYWLHKDSIVALKTSYQNDTVKILGITPDHGMLKVESLQHQGKLYGLLPNSHFLDMEQSLIRSL
ncbi:Biotin--protein ligase [Choanephora cucurbitarum]|uniref:Biotin--protein ligase n=1 Tax=Choanephora cucurbitarum TaxID=101091 RepID=A0A1C7N9P3_9FUNG|nr:Biotin--protein ligase [Choanephora cucurbitarum]